ncbi:MAG: hypothetical protein WD871_01815 [Xanthobacteraceae bacterium]
MRKVLAAYARMLVVAAVLFVAIGAFVALGGCGELPQEARDREQREETVKWLERREIERSTRERESGQ